MSNKSTSAKDIYTLLFLFAIAALFIVATGKLKASQTDDFSHSHPSQQVN